MRWIAVLALLLTITLCTYAAGPDDDYVDIYNEVILADNLQRGGHTEQAVAKYMEAQAGLRRLKAEHPTWNTEIIAFRLDYVSEQLQALQKLLPAASPGKTTVAPATVPMKAATESPAPAASEITSLQEQIHTLLAANSDLQNKLKEALSIQPAAASSQDLAKAQEKIVALQKENDLLTVNLQQAKANAAKPVPNIESEKTTRELAETKQALADLKTRAGVEAQATKAEIERLKGELAAAQRAQAPSAPQTSEKNLIAERDRLKEQLAARTKDLADAESRRDLVELRTQLTVVQQERDDLKAKLASGSVAAPPSSDAQVEPLRARLAVLEAQAVPYTPEELAVLKKNQTAAPTNLPAAPAEPKHIVHSKRDLPPGTQGLMSDAARAMMERNYHKAISDYEDILRQDENNVYVLAHLGTAELAMDDLGACEKAATRALALDPEDPASLYLVGIVRYRQERIDEALDALSRSAKYNPTNASTQNYLGCVLADKGLRSQAETAFRKAIVDDPNYADPNFNLAFVYAEEKPPSLELARWHYQRAQELGHRKSEELEKLLSSTH